MKFVLATHNPGKLKEMADILSGLGVEVVSPADVGISVDVEETGTTFAENAMLKAKAICAASGLPAIADDSGLCVDALNGGPGVYSARYGGEELDDRGRYTLLLQNMRGQTTRAAHFACAIACAFPGGDELTAEGRCDGAIAFAPMGTAGFGYDPKKEPSTFDEEGTAVKTTGRCPKCGSADLLAVEPGLYNSFPIGFFVNAKIQRYVCRSCGYTEELIA